MYLHSASGHKVAVEMVGLGVGDKLRKHQEDLSRLPAVYVNDACVDTVGRPGMTVLVKRPPSARGTNKKNKWLWGTRFGLGLGLGLGLAWG